MTLLIQPRLVNEPYSDPGLLLDFKFGARAILFDLGNLSALAPREILRTTHIFVSHMHVDHFIGFDHLLRLCLYRDKRLNIIGPPGIGDAVGAKLRGYTWNLLDEQARDFSIVASDWTDDGFVASSIYRARDAFVRQPQAPERANLPLDEAEFCIEAATLDHGIPSLAFAFQEKVRINVHKARLDELGLPVGPWLSEAKHAARADAEAETEFMPASGRSISLRELLDAGALRHARGQRIVYATDLAHHAENITRLHRLAQGADQLFIEGGFLEEDRQLAASKKHLTARQAGEIARVANVREAHQMHLSPRYLGRKAELREEFERGFRSTE
ncbi:ribonuclease Z [Chelativorans salis]|uniref:MBL fold metallo-hydrolase n=1 Tax=Chelativorans salis TaxID=2978478 RepID=A0ABT2LIV9_9HYPH|nr:MBL fold metallo-hydrolase [Chelativorans sp. EGI FJ00035]MCT7374176.1 MBL fold metallo-hydrolase [Chelativorans sp. EGI FJ00035]